MLIPETIGAPFTTVAAVDNNKDTTNFASILTGSLVGLWDRLVSVKDILVRACRRVAVANGNRRYPPGHSLCVCAGLLSGHQVDTV